MSIHTKGISKGAYQGELTCPFCGGKSIRYVEHVTPTRLRYRCRKDGLAFQYDISNRHDINPYAAYEGSKFGQHIKKMLAGRKLKGGIK